MAPECAMRGYLTDKADVYSFGVVMLELGLSNTGLARKEDFPYITYYCPHCHVLNSSQQSGDHGSNLSFAQAKPTPPGDGNGSTSVRASTVPSNWATVQELPAADGNEVENEVDVHAS